MLFLYRGALYGQADWTVRCSVGLSVPFRPS